MDDTTSNTANSLSEKSAAISLGLYIPEQAPAPADSMLLDPKDTQEWISGLPMANIGETARQIYGALVNFNRYVISDLIRAKSVEQFRKPVSYICTNLQRHYIDTGFPLTTKGWKTAVLSRELNTELAISYKIIIEHMLAGDSRHFDRKLLVIALHRALLYLGNVLLQSSLAYSPWPQRVWKEINSLYAFASQNHVHQVPVKSNTRKKGEISSIEDNFKALLLFASAAPFRMRQKHISQLFHKTQEWSKHAQLSKNSDNTASSIGRFNIDLWTDEAPIHNALRSPTNNNRSITIDLRPLLKKLREDFEEAPWDDNCNFQSESNVITRPLLRQLIAAWSRPPERKYVRTKLNFELNIVTGIHAIHGNLDADFNAFGDQGDSHFLEEYIPLSQDPQIASSSASLLGLSSGLSLSPLNADLNADSLINDSYLSTSALNDSRPNDSQPDNTGLASTQTIPTSKVQTSNESAGGYCVQWIPDNQTKVKIGELIGVESSSHRQEYGLGVIRWLRHNDQHNLEVGLQMISNHIEAAQTYLANTDNSRRKIDPHRINCLLLPAIENDSTTSVPSLIMSNISFPVGSNLWLNTNQDERLIRLTKLIEFSNAFAQFQFSYINTDDKTHDSSLLNDEERDFDDLWTNL